MVMPLRWALLHAENTATPVGTAPGNGGKRRFTGYL